MVRHHRATELCESSGLGNPHGRLYQLVGAPESPAGSGAHQLSGDGSWQVSNLFLVWKTRVLGQTGAWTCGVFLSEIHHGWVGGCFSENNFHRQVCLMWLMWPLWPHVLCQPGWQSRPGDADGAKVGCWKMGWYLKLVRLGMDISIEDLGSFA